MYENHQITKLWGHNLKWKIKTFLAFWISLFCSPWLFSCHQLRLMGAGAFKVIKGEINQDFPSTSISVWYLDRFINVLEKQNRSCGFRELKTSLDSEVHPSIFIVLYQAEQESAGAFRARGQRRENALDRSPGHQRTHTPTVETTTVHKSTVSSTVFTSWRVHLT